MVLVLRQFRAALFVKGASLQSGDEITKLIKG